MLFRNPIMHPSFIYLILFLFTKNTFAIDRKIHGKAKILSSNGHVKPKPVLCLNDCSGNGYCENGICLCEPRYKGDDCSIDSCSHIEGGCHGNGGERVAKIYTFVTFAFVDLLSKITALNHLFLLYVSIII